jgi:hypothetical protein
MSGPGDGGGGRKSRIAGGQAGGAEGSGGSKGRGGAADCLTMYRGAGLASPKSNVLSKLKIGDKLDLQPHAQGTSYVLDALWSGDRAGVITHKLIDQIIRCIVEGGYTYVAQVKTLDGGSCSLEIRMKV